MIVYIMVNSTAYTGYQEMTGIQTDIWEGFGGRKININLCPPIYFHKRTTELIKIWPGYPLLMLYQVVMYLRGVIYKSIFYDVD